MAHTTEHTSPSKSSTQLPAARGPFEGVVEARDFGALPSFAGDLVNSLNEARDVVTGLGLSSTSDVSVSALTALVCNSATPAAALDAAADALRKAPTLEPHSIALARVPGARDGLWEWSVTLMVSSRDPLTGEYGGDTHHTVRPR